MSAGEGAGAERAVSDINRHTSLQIPWSCSQVFTFKKSDLSFPYENFMGHTSVAAPVTDPIPGLEHAPESLVRDCRVTLKLTSGTI